MACVVGGLSCRLTATGGTMAVQSMAISPLCGVVLGVVAVGAIVVTGVVVYKSLKDKNKNKNRT